MHSQAGPQETADLGMLQGRTASRCGQAVRCMQAQVSVKTAPVTSLYNAGYARYRKQEVRAANSEEAYTAGTGCPVTTSSDAVYVPELMANLSAERCSLFPTRLQGV
jgi:hypothetical protein